MNYHHGKLMIGALLSVLLSLPLSTGAYAAEADMALSISGADGKNMLSLTEQQEIIASVPIDSAIDPSTVSWTLSRSAGAMDAKLFPYQFLGGSLDSWKLWGKDAPLFTQASSKVTTNGTQSVLELTLKTDYFFGTNQSNNPRANRNVILDYTGDYILKATDASGNVLGSSSLHVAPYADYRTNAKSRKSSLLQKNKPTLSRDSTWRFSRWASLQTVPRYLMQS